MTTAMWCVSALLLACALVTQAVPAADNLEALNVLRRARPLKATVPLRGGASRPAARAAGAARIVGGAEAARGQFPFQAAVVPINGLTGFCGGSLISTRWVLTAGFCVYGSQGAIVYLGAYDLSDPDSQLQVLQVGAEALALHPDFEYLTINNNIALIDLGTDVTLSELVQPVQLVLEEPQGLTGQLVSVSGWGLVHDSGITLSNKLRFVELPLIDNFSCRQYYGLIVVTESTVCADGHSLDGAIATFCGGDLGGPLLLEGSSPALLGVASFIASVSCERGYPSGYERVPAHAAWIRSLTGL